MDSLDILRLFPFFADVPPERREEILGAVQHLRFSAGTLTFLTGSSCGAVAFVGSGRIRVVKTDESGREITLYHVSGGETCLLTLSCALTGDPYVADGFVDDDVEAVGVPIDIFRQWFDTDPAFRAYVIRILTDRMVEMMQLVESVAFHRIGPRLATYLTEASQGGRLVDLVVTHDRIAAELGATRETISRTLKDFERRGLVSLSRGSVRLVDPPSLAALGM